jgi:hypothetical protein
MLNEKASQAATDAVAEAVSCQIDDPDVTVEIHRKIKFYLFCLNYVQIKITHNNIMSK